MKKLHLDALVIQQGRLAEKEKNMSKDELMSAIRYGADDVFKDDGGEDEEIDIDAILAKAEEKTKSANEKWDEAKTKTNMYLFVLIVIWAANKRFKISKCKF